MRPLFLQSGTIRLAILAGVAFLLGACSPELIRPDEPRFAAHTAEQRTVGAANTARDDGILAMLVTTAHERLRQAELVLGTRDRTLAPALLDAYCTILEKGLMPLLAGEDPAGPIPAEKGRLLELLAEQRKSIYRLLSAQGKTPGTSEKLRRARRACVAASDALAVYGGGE